MKKIGLFLFLSCAVSLSAMVNGSKVAENKVKNQRGQVVEYPGVSDGLTPGESLVISIEDMKYNIEFYVDNFGPGILKKIDPVTGLTMEQLAGNAGNHEAYRSIKSYLDNFDLSRK